MASSYFDTTAIYQVIGCVFNSPELLDEQEKYTIHEDDFVDEFHKIVFGSIYNIHLTGSKVDLNTIIDYLAVRPKFKAIFDQNKGVEYLQKISSIATKDTFNYYYNRLKKMSLLRAYNNYGLDVSYLYDPNNILDSKKKQQQEDWLDNTSLAEIATSIDSRIEEIKSKYVEQELGRGYQAGDGALELIARLEESPEIGIPMYGPLINTVTRGARLRKFYLRSAATGLGKAIPDYVKIPTPQGWRTIGDIHPGDYLFGQDGKPTKVLAIHPQQEEKEIWEVEFADGKVVECCKDHLWEYRYETHNGSAYRVESVEQIYNRTLKLKNGLKNSNGKGFRFHIRLNEAVEYPEKVFSVHPYIMGALLGDGSFRYDKTNKAITFSSETDELPAKIASLLGNYIHKKNSEYNYSYCFKPLDNLEHNLWVEEILKDYPELWQAKSENKFIPPEYLLGSVEQRWQLLQGLMDTDGHIDSKKGRTGFTTNSPKLRDDVIELARSLGMVATYLVDQRSEKYTTGECYAIHIQAKKEVKHKMFSLKRKVDVAIAYQNNGKRAEKKDHLAIVSIRKTERKTSMTCFTVDNDSHLFLVDNYYTTHNTRSMVADACNFATNRLYSTEFGMWINNGIAQPTLFIATEQDLSEIQTLMLAFLSGVNESHILDGEYAEGEKERVVEAARVLKESPLWIEEMPDFSLQDIENKIKQYIREKDVLYICLDYIHSSMKILEEITKRSGGVRLREDNILFMLATKLKDICNQYGVFILSGTQLNANYLDSDTPDQNLLRGAKSIGDRVDLGMIMLAPTNDDLVKIEPVIAANPSFETPNMKISVYKNRRGAYKGIYLWCVADLGTCRIKPIFATNYRHELVPIEDARIIIDNQPSAF